MQGPDRFLVPKIKQNKMPLSLMHLEHCSGEQLASDHLKSSFTNGHTNQMMLFLLIHLYLEKGQDNFLIGQFACGERPREFF